MFGTEFFINAQTFTYTDNFALGIRRDHNPKGTVLYPVWFTLYTTDRKNTQPCHSPAEVYSNAIACVGSIRDGLEDEHKA